MDVLPSPTGLLLRGQVVDARTGQGLPFVEVAPYSLGQKPSSSVQADSEGRFELQTSMGAEHFAFARDRLTGKRLARRKVDTLFSEGGLWRVDVGPTLIVRLRGAPENVEGWRVRLVERSSENEEHPWNWCDVEHVEPDGAFAVRYRRFEREPGSEDRIWVQVEEPTATWKGEQEIDRAPGVHSVDIDVDVFAASLSGRVVNDLGVPLKASVTALRQGFRRTPEKPWPQTETDEQGAWRLSGLDPGPTRLLVVSDHLPTQSMNVLLERGEHEQLDIVLPSLAIAGSIRASSWDLRTVTPRWASCGCNRWRRAARTWCNSVSRAGTRQRVRDASRQKSVRLRERPDRALPSRSSLSRWARLCAGILLGRGTGDGRVQDRGDVRSRRPTRVQPEPARLDHGQPLTHPFAVLHLDSFWVSQVQEGDPLQEFGHFGQRLPISIILGHAGYRPAVLQMPDAIRAAQRIGSRMEVVFELEQGFGAALVVLDAGYVLGGSEADFDDVLPMEWTARSAHPLWRQGDRHERLQRARAVQERRADRGVRGRACRLVRARRGALPRPLPNAGRLGLRAHGARLRHGRKARWNESEHAPEGLDRRRGRRSCRTHLVRAAR